MDEMAQRIEGLELEAARLRERAEHADRQATKERGRALAAERDREAAQLELRRMQALAADVKGDPSIDALVRWLTQEVGAETWAESAIRERLRRLVEARERGALTEVEHGLRSLGLEVLTEATSANLVAAMGRELAGARAGVTRIEGIMDGDATLMHTHVGDCIENSGRPPKGWRVLQNSVGAWCWERSKAGGCIGKHGKYGDSDRAKAVAACRADREALVGHHDEPCELVPEQICSDLEWAARILEFHGNPDEETGGRLAAAIRAVEAERDESRRQLEHARSLMTHARALLSGAKTWAGDLAIVPAEPVRRLAALLGMALDHDDDVPLVQVQRDGLPEARHLERVSFAGHLREQWATMWCRENSPAPAATPVPWSTTDAHPWVVEIHLRTKELDGKGYGSTAFSVPCAIDPRAPSPEADAAIALAALRGMIHEAQESLLLDGQRYLDPHSRGEIGLATIGRMLGAWPFDANHDATPHGGP